MNKLLYKNQKIMIKKLITTLIISAFLWSNYSTKAMLENDTQIQQSEVLEARQRNKEFIIRQKKRDRDSFNPWLNTKTDVPQKKTVGWWEHLFGTTAIDKEVAKKEFDATQDEVPTLSPEASWVDKIHHFFARQKKKLVNRKHVNDKNSTTAFDVVDDAKYKFNGFLLAGAYSLVDSFEKLAIWALCATVAVAAAAALVVVVSQLGTVVALISAIGTLLAGGALFAACYGIYRLIHWLGGGSGFSAGIAAIIFIILFYIVVRFIFKKIKDKKTEETKKRNKTLMEKAKKLEWSDIVKGFDALVLRAKKGIKNKLRGGKKSKHKAVIISAFISGVVVLLGVAILIFRRKKDGKSFDPNNIELQRIDEFKPSKIDVKNRFCALDELTLAENKLKETEFVKETNQISSKARARYTQSMINQIDNELGWGNPSKQRKAQLIAQKKALQKKNSDLRSIANKLKQLDINPFAEVLDMDDVDLNLTGISDEED